MGLLKNLEKKKAAEAKAKIDAGGYTLNKKEKDLLKKYYPNSDMNF